MVLSYHLMCVQVYYSDDHAKNGFFLVGCFEDFNCGLKTEDIKTLHGHNWLNDKATRAVSYHSNVAIRFIWLPEQLKEN